MCLFCCLNLFLAEAKDRLCRCPALAKQFRDLSYPVFIGASFQEAVLLLGAKTMEAVVLPSQGLLYYLTVEFFLSRKNSVGRRCLHFWLAPAKQQRSRSFTRALPHGKAEAIHGFPFRHMLWSFHAASLRAGLR